MIQCAHRLRLTTQLGTHKNSLLTTISMGIMVIIPSLCNILHYLMFIEKILRIDHWGFLESFSIGMLYLKLFCFLCTLGQRHKSFLLSAMVSISNVFRAFLYPLYLSFKITLQADFWTLSKSSIFSWDSELCRSVADCSSRLLTTKMYIVFRSS